MSYPPEHQKVTIEIPLWNDGRVGDISDDAVVNLIAVGQFMVDRNADVTTRTMDSLNRYPGVVREWGVKTTGDGIELPLRHYLVLQLTVPV